MKNEIFIQLMQRRVAQVAVGASALRNQGCPEIVDKCRKYFEEANLKNFFYSITDEHPTSYYSLLTQHTTNLSHQFPDKCRNNFGAARKALNLFYRDVVYNSYLTTEYNFDINSPKGKIAISRLEVPLDNYVVNGLKAKSKVYGNFPKWKSIKDLREDESDAIQTIARQYADSLGIARVHLDLVFWRPKANDITASSQH